MSLEIDIVYELGTRKQKRTKLSILVLIRKAKGAIFGFCRDANRSYTVKGISCIAKASVPLHPPHHHSDTGLRSLELHCSVSSVQPVMLHSCQMEKNCCLGIDITTF